MSRRQIPIPFSIASIKRSLRRSLGPAVVAIGAIGCADSIDPGEVLEGHLALAPQLTAGALGLVDVARAHIRLERSTGSEVALDTVIDVVGDSIDIAVSVSLKSADESFLLTLTLTSSAGDTVFRAGPLSVMATMGTDGTASPIMVALQYVGPGSNAQSVVITPASVSVLTGDSVALAAEARDSAGASLPGTPIDWSSLNTIVAAVPDQASGNVVAGTQVGVAQIVARLLTGQADTVMVSVVRDVLMNGGFETGDITDWTVTNAGSGDFFVMSGDSTPQSLFPVLPPPEGTFAALTDQGGPGMHILHRDVIIPSGAVMMFLATVYVLNRAGAHIVGPDLRHDMGPNQHFRVDIMDPNFPVDDVGTGVLQNVFLTQAGDSLAIPYTNISADLTQYAGQTVRIRFAEVDNQFFFHAGVDAVSITTTSPTAAPLRSPPASVRRFKVGPPEVPDRRYQRER